MDGGIKRFVILLFIKNMEEAQELIAEGVREEHY